MILLFRLFSVHKPSATLLNVSTNESIMDFLGANRILFDQTFREEISNISSGEWNSIKGMEDFSEFDNLTMYTQISPFYSDPEVSGNLSLMLLCIVWGLAEEILEPLTSGLK